MARPVGENRRVPGRKATWQAGERRGRARRQALRRRRRLVGGLVVLATAITALSWPGSRPRTTSRRAGWALPAVVATDPPAGTGPVAPTAGLELETTTERGVDPAEVQLSPPVPGRWRWCATDRLCFRPATPLAMGATETLRVLLHPYARSGQRLSRRRARPKLFTTSFRVATESVGLAQVLLADLDYLPLRPPATLAPEPEPGADKEEAAGSPASTATSTAGTSLAASLTWRWSSVPASLRALWSPGRMTVLTIGALVQFERVDGLTSGGYPPYGSSLTPTVWRALFAAALAERDDPDPYSYAEVSEAEPERLVLWSDGHDVLTTLVNTGIQGTTPTGSWAVYLRYPEQTMRGTTVSGQPYVYPDVKDVSYFEGNFAVHAFPRLHYGFPQSQGCVEVPPTVAPRIYALLHYGSLVTVKA